MKTCRMALGWLLIALIGLVACKTSDTKGVDPFAAADEEDEASLLDEPVENKRARSAPTGKGKATADEAVMMLPDPPAEMAITVDGEVDDWGGAKVRSFDRSRFVAEGSQFWSGSDDAGFTVGVQADAGHIYFRVDVRDDKVMDAESAEVMADGIIIWLRDPALENIVDSLPDSVRRAKSVQPELAILFTPDGQFWRYDHKDGTLYRTGIDAVTKKTDQGYRLEAALTLGVLQQVAKLPTDKAAFRVEVMDGDEPDRRGEQTRMSMLPDGAGPRFALLRTGGWLPYEEARGQPTRPGALGRWQLADGVWRFESFEVVPTHWLVMEDVSGFDKALANSKALSELCPAATSERTLIEAYQSRSGRHRAGLVMCGTRAPRGQCPKDAVSHLYLVHLKPTKQGWELTRGAEVSADPLKQCADHARPDGDLYTDFALFPMEVVGSRVWGVGWTKLYEGSAEKLRHSGVWFVDPTSQKPFLGEAQTERIHAWDRQRTVSKSRVYLTPVDDKKGLDVCEVEHLEKQQCRSFDRGCSPIEDSDTVRNTIKTWVPQKGRFESYFLSKHKRCSGDIDLAKRKGYMILQQPGRLGLLASPANQAKAGSSRDSGDKKGVDIDLL